MKIIPIVISMYLISNNPKVEALLSDNVGRIGILIIQSLADLQVLFLGEEHVLGANLSMILASLLPFGQHVHEVEHQQRQFLVREGQSRFLAQIHLVAQVLVEILVEGPDLKRHQLIVFF